MSVTGTVLDEQSRMTLGELCRVCDVNAEYVLAMVAEGVIDPLGQEPAEWRFSAAAIPRIHTAMRLQHDMELNLAGAALALDLLDEIRALRTRLQRLERLFDEPG